MHRVTPNAFVVGETRLIPENFQSFLEEIGVPEWKTDAGSDTEVIVEAAGKLCYMSFSTDLNENLTRVGTRNNFDYIQQGLIGAKHGCYDPETEVLTSEGWKFWPDVSKEDFLATRTADGVLEYHRPLHMVAAPYKGRMYRTEARGVDLLVTDNHNMLVCPTTTVKGRKKEDFQLIQAAALGHISHSYVKTATWKSDNGNLTPPQLALLGFAIGDGYLSGKLKFRLRKERKINYLTVLCNSIGLKLEVLTNDTYAVTLPKELLPLFSSMYDDNREKVIPPGVLLTHSKVQLESLLCGLMQSDGHHGMTGDSFDTTSQTLVGQIQQLCLHVGIAANICYTYEKDRRQSSLGDKPLTRLSIIRRELKPEVNKFVDGVGKTSWVDDWEGMVYCAEVPNNTLYVRRNGIPVWCGNSVLEHTAVNLVLTNVSRVCTHELVRHRSGAAYSQVSGRYVRLHDLPFWIPSCISSDPELLALFEEAILHQEAIIRKMAEVSRIESLDFKAKKTLTSAFRRIIGNGVANHIECTYNHRALRHVIEMRTSRHAEEEIRLVFNQVFEAVSKRYPALYADAVHCLVDGLREITFVNSKV